MVQVPLTNKTCRDIGLSELRLVFDLDGLIAIHPEDPQIDYVKHSMPDLKLINLVNKLHKQGVIIIIYTARKMRTTEGNIGKLMKKTAKETLDWLDSNGVEYDEIYFGKPWGHKYYDDLSLNYDRGDMIRELKSYLIRLKSK